jgi:hypothetical protein
VDPNFAGYSFDLVFRYQYVGEELWQHGGVKVRVAAACARCNNALRAERRARLRAGDVQGPPQLHGLGDGGRV